ncbi:ExbD/TolR family protein [Pseudophaeobacter arcticus]|jgi:biopolymer transport protein ExbD|uniref:ExbD/TolR family protein n=1 Tax=Pseudophaeobacter arcticus TaxID=385492 RepID=UPI00248F738C|nr:biopolymer transporter ExbD [Pseudophaeobacter arcticus]
MTLTRRARPQALISLVPMIDVMLILLVFFMVTSTYLNLDMIPALHPAEGAAKPNAASSLRLMIRIQADGRPSLRGETLSPQDLNHILAQALAKDPLAQLVILPSSSASTQDLISIMDQSATAGVQNMRVLRLEARQ